MDERDATTKIRLAALRSGGVHDFRLEPDAEVRAEIAGELDLLGLKKLRLEGRLVPEGKSDWRLDAMLGATVVQPCVVTLKPVTTRIDTEVRRLYLAEFTTPQGDEVEMPEDDDQEPLGREIDLAAVMIEALSLALPVYPRADEAELGEANFTEPGKQAMTDDDARPFAALAALKAQQSDEE